MAMPKYRIPLHLEIAIQEIENPTLAGSIILGKNKFWPILKKLKNSTNRSIEIEECHYLQLLKLGLYLEEYEQGKVISDFKIYGTTIQQEQNSKRQFKIFIKNLNRDRQVLNISDCLLVYEQNNTDAVFFLKVTKHCRDHVIVRANEMFCKAYSDLAQYNVELIFNNYSFQCCHYALTAIAPSTVSFYFFPKKTENNALELNNPPSWFNTDVSAEQKQAVLNIINKSAYPAPYILCGPPGTGKTSTLVEAVCQIWDQQSCDKILICALSNTACDVVTKRLLDYKGMLNGGELFRIYSQFQEPYKIDEDIKSISKDSGDLKKNDFFFTKVIVTTLCTSIRLEKFNLTFSHVFIDEAGQASQVDTLLPLCALKCSRSCQIVISGDHQLLGPCIRSKLAEPLLGQPILEKLMKHVPYQKNVSTGYDPRYITKLTRNFRSSKDIIHVPNVLFYGNELLTASSNRMESNTLPTIAFYAIEGKEEKTWNFKNYSSYNVNEINQVLTFVESFIGKQVGDKIIGRKDIGIVTPFSLQASKIREKLNSIGLKEVDVGNVETYQGQEKEIIIISTVKNKAVNHNDVAWNARRFNVAITRAKTTLMVVGNPYALQTNKYWQYFLKFCKENNACYGGSFQINSCSSSSSLFDWGSLAAKVFQTKGGDSSKSIKSTDLFDSALTTLEIDEDIDNESTSTVYYYRRRPYSGRNVYENNKLFTFLIFHLVLYVFSILSIEENNITLTDNEIEL